MNKLLKRVNTLFLLGTRANFGIRQTHQKREGFQWFETLEKRILIVIWCRKKKRYMTAKGLPCPPRSQSQGTPLAVAVVRFPARAGVATCRRLGALYNVYESVQHSI